MCPRARTRKHLLPTENRPALNEAIRKARYDPSMHQPLKDLMVWLGMVPVLQDRDNVAEFPR